MSHITLRVGRFFTPLPLGEGAGRAGEGPRATNGQCHRRPGESRCAVTAPESRGRDDLAFFGLCLEVNHDDPHAELERLSLVTPDAEVWDARNDPRLYLL
jgi:hypothetical protein